MPNHRIYTEVYGGGASVLLRKPRAFAEIYNDLDGEMVNLFRVARDQGKDLREAVRLTPFAREEFNLSYQPGVSSLEQARRTIVRSFMGFGSNSHNRQTGFRANSNRSRSTPAHDWKNWPGAFEEIISRLQGVVIENRPAIQVLLQHDKPNALHYVDPPYLASTRDRGADYRFEMDDAAHRELAAVLNSLKGGVILSGYASPLYDELYHNWRSVERQALADGAAVRTEKLWIRNIHNVSPEFDFS